MKESLIPLLIVLFPELGHPGTYDLPNTNEYAHFMQKEQKNSVQIE